jgi:hypothetical protein
MRTHRRVYFFWSFHSASEDTFDFENGAHDVQRVFDYAKQAGLYALDVMGAILEVESILGSGVETPEEID